MTKCFMHYKFILNIIYLPTKHDKTSKVMFVDVRGSQLGTSEISNQ